MLAEHTKPNRKRGDDEKIQAVVLAALKSKYTTEFNASARIKTMDFAEINNRTLFLFPWLFSVLH